MRRSQIQYFKSGVHNLLDEEIIPKDALQNAKNWQTIDGKISLVNGKIILGAEGASGKTEDFIRVIKLMEQLSYLESILLLSNTGTQLQKRGLT